MVINRGDIWWATLPKPRGSEPGFGRPVLVIQADSFNSSRIGTVIVAATTSNLRPADAPGNVHLTQRQSNLTRESVVNVSQVITIDRGFLREKVGRLAPALMKEDDSGLRLTLMECLN